ncbi:DUF6429 family protein [Catenovulum sp. SX2]
MLSICKARNKVVSDIYLGPVGKAKSVVLTDEGVQESEALFKQLFAK